MPITSIGMGYPHDFGNLHLATADVRWFINSMNDSYLGIVKHSYWYIIGVGTMSYSIIPVLKVFIEVIAIRYYKQ